MEKTLKVKRVKKNKEQQGVEKELFNSFSSGFNASVECRFLPNSSARDLVLA
jgi:hypothetical protein